MYIKLTPKQLTVLKKLLPTVKLNAYDIEIYQEIQKALAEPVENIDKPKDNPKKNFSQNHEHMNKKTSVPPKPQKTSDSPKPQKLAKLTEEKTSDSQNQEYIESIKTDKKREFKHDEIVEDSEQLNNNESDEEDLEDLEKDSESIFAVIDSRTQKTVL